jgi:hypothetical protein
MEDGCLPLRGLLGGALEQEAPYAELVVTLVTESEGEGAAAAPRVRAVLR